VALALVAGLVAIVATYRDYGITWDEDVQARYGDMVLDYFLSGFEDRAYQDFHDLRFYGPTFEVLPAIVARATGAPLYETRHFLNALTGLLTLLAVVRLARHAGDEWAVIFSALAFALLPGFYGHAFNNSKDVPFACAFAWAMASIVGLAATERRTPGRICLTGVAVGVTLSLRAGGILLLGFAGVCLAGRWVIARRPFDLRAWAIALVQQMLIISGVAWVVMVAPWPWAHESPIFNPLAALGENLDFGAVKEVLWDGVLVSSQDAPRSYLPWLLLITTPLPVLLLAPIGFAALVRGDGAPQTERRILALALALWLVVPIGYVVLSRPTVYDGMRHFLFLLPAFALAAGCGAAWLCRLAPVGRPRLAATAALLVVLALPLRDLIVLHPYQSVYFNPLVGGVAGASGRYDTEYWGASYREAAQWIIARHPPPGRFPRLLVAGTDRAQRCISAFLPPLTFVLMFNARGVTEPLPREVDYYVALTRRHYDRNFPDAPIVHRIERDGATLAVIKGHRPRATP
jgi:4-amino-4-deoxy-L-arabinose transferase-like glycosyltransferase